MSTRTSKTKVAGRLSHVRKEQDRYRFSLRECNIGPRAQTFLLSAEKALTIANGDEAFPLGVQVEVAARFEEEYSGKNLRKLTHVKILSVDGVETRAWSERVGSTQVDPAVITASSARVAKAKAAEEAAMADRSPPEPAGVITDPSIAFENAMRIVRRQRKLKDPKLSQSEIWQLRDALNLLAEKLGIG